MESARHGSRAATAIGREPPPLREKPRGRLSKHHRSAERKPERTQAMNTFAAYTVGLDLARALEPIIEQIKLRSSELADQIDRARISIICNVSEGARRSGLDRRRFYGYASGSASEILGALDLASLPRRGPARACTPRSRARPPLGPDARSQTQRGVIDRHPVSAETRRAGNVSSDHGVVPRKRPHELFAGTFARSRRVPRDVPRSRMRLRETSTIVYASPRERPAIAYASCGHVGV